MKIEEKKIRTNLRSWRNEAVYFITVKEQEGFIKAELEAITVGPLTEVVLKNLFNTAERAENSKTYYITHNRTIGLTTPQEAVKEAIRRYMDDANHLN